MSKNDKATYESNGFLQGRLLVSTPLIQDGCFEKSVIYLCNHDANGAMGIIINKVIEDIDPEAVLDQFSSEFPESEPNFPIYLGGPVDTLHGFVLHTSDYQSADTFIINRQIALTASVDVLREIVTGHGPRKSILALGYAGWGPGQMEAEIEKGSWITVDATPELIFNLDNDVKWAHAMQALGIDPLQLSTTAGHA